MVIIKKERTKTSSGEVGNNYNKKESNNNNDVNNYNQEFGVENNSIFFYSNQYKTGNDLVDLMHIDKVINWTRVVKGVSMTSIHKVEEFDECDGVVSIHKFYEGGDVGFIYKVKDQRLE